MPVQLATDPELWLRRFFPSHGASARVVFLPHAGGSASFYHPLCKELAGSADVVAVQYPGRQERRAEPRVEDLHTMADLLAQVLQDRMDLPTVFFGHSMGATLAYEVALRLQARGQGPAALMASARCAPSRQLDDDLHLRADARMLAEVKRLDSPGSELLDDPELAEFIMPVLRSDYTAINTYRHRPGQRLSVPVSVLVGDRDPKMPESEAGAWAEHTTAGSDVHVFRGGHFYLSEHVGPVARLVERTLGGVVPGGG